MKKFACIGILVVGMFLSGCNSGSEMVDKTEQVETITTEVMSEEQEVINCQVYRKVGVYYTSSPEKVTFENIAYLNSDELEGKVGYFEKVSEPAILSDSLICDLKAEYADSDITSRYTSMEEASEAFSSEQAENSLDGIYVAAAYAEDQGDVLDYKNIIVVIDSHAPEFSGVSDIAVEQEDVSVTPDVDLNGITANDEFDGEITDIRSDIQLSDEKNHIYMVTLSCADQRKNIAQTSYTITVRQKPLPQELANEKQEASEPENTQKQQTLQQSAQGHNPMYLQYLDIKVDGELTRYPADCNYFTDFTEKAVYTNQIYACYSNGTDTLYARMYDMWCCYDYQTGLNGIAAIIPYISGYQNTTYKDKNYTLFLMRENQFLIYDGEILRHPGCRYTDGWGQELFADMGGQPDAWTYY